MIDEEQANDYIILLEIAQRSGITSITCKWEGRQLVFRVGGSVPASVAFANELRCFAPPFIALKVIRENEVL